MCVHVRNIPAGVKLENGEQYEVNARVKGNGTDLFAYIFSDGLNVDVDYSKFVRNGGNLAMSLKTIRERVANILNTDLGIARLFSGFVACGCSEGFGNGSGREDSRG